MVRAESITKRYQQIEALKSVSFSADKGELFGFIGPDGSGKTSLFRILTTLILPDSGTASLNGLDIIKDFRKIRNLVGYMPGQFSLYSDLSVEENLEFFATVFGSTIDVNYHLIKDIYAQIEPYKTRLAGKLSGGMKQKLALSCALIHEPVILILDEPTTGVDAVSRKEFWDLLMGLKAKGITILVSTPYMDEASLCDRVALIQKGQIMITDTPGNIVNGFDREIVSIRSANLYKLLKDIREYEFTESVYPFGQDLHYTGMKKKADLADIEKFLLRRGHKDIVISRIRAGIEDVFMGLMKKEGTSESGSDIY
jgi:ABC-2 type transport system ATP-binding protein